MDKADDIKKDELIEQFLDGELTGKALLDFKQQIKTNRALAQEIALRKEIIFALKHQKLIQFNRKVEGIVNSTTIEPDMDFKWSDWKYFRFLKWSIISIVFSLLTLMGWQQYENDQLTQKMDNLYNEYIMHHDERIGLPEDDPSILALGLKHYSNRNYTDAIVALEQYLALEEEDTQVRLYLGVAYLMIQDIDVAELEFKKIISANENIFTQHSKWYLSLIYLKKQDKEAAKSMLQSLTQSDDYSEKTNTILEKL